MQNLPRAEDKIARIIELRGQLYEALREIPWLKPYPSQANFILCKVENISAVELKQRLRDGGILIRHFDKPGLDDHIRISVGTEEQSEILINALKGFGNL